MIIRDRIRKIVQAEIDHQQKIIDESTDPTETHVATAIRSLLERLLAHV